MAARRDSGAGQGPGQGAPGAQRLVRLEIDETTIGRGTPEIEHEREVAIYDLLEKNSFALSGGVDGPYALTLSISENRLVFRVACVRGEDRADDEETAAIILSLTPFRRIVKDYFLVLDSYYQAIRTSAPSRIEAIDMGRRGLHDEGSEVLRERLKGKIEIDRDTARRLFTLICVLHWKG